MKKSVALRLSAIPAFVVATSGAAHAALPAAVTTAIGDAGTDMATAITAIITAFVVFWGLRKLGSKMGWL